MSLIEIADGKFVKITIGMVVGIITAAVTVTLWLSSTQSKADTALRRLDAQRDKIEKMADDLVSIKTSNAEIKAILTEMKDNQKRQ